MFVVTCRSTKNLPEGTYNQSDVQMVQNVQQRNSEITDFNKSKKDKNNVIQYFSFKFT